MDSDEESNTMVSSFNNDNDFCKYTESEVEIAVRSDSGEDEED